ncbi:inosine triphosphatase [Durotheca rogersii]|uniref:inosine triphosphatase n=1 Tax=Durotheca rogersii TaxID=419775 RepID=UPI00221F427F|nr:inosine triphosphatase [Durotheca rogersii]KAI5862840.1 inosine triphosphatase [Durotheca rogersii]
MATATTAAAAAETAGRPVVNFITGNANKLREVRAILEPAGIAVRSEALDLPEVQGTLDDVTRAKCRAAAAAVAGPVLVEDTGLCFDALHGLPGPYIKWFMQSVGHVGLNNLLAAYEDKSAQAVATFGFCRGPGHEVLLFQGRTHGKIVPPRGPATFGWDPVFEYDGQTYAEMDKDEKNKISHRFKALEKLRAWIEAGGLAE